MAWAASSILTFVTDNDKSRDKSAVNLRNESATFFLVYSYDLTRQKTK